MIVKIMCANNIDFAGLVSDYLTVGKIYTAIKSVDGEFALLCDEGTLINDNFDYPIHAKWEVVSE